MSWMMSCGLGRHAILFAERVAFIGWSTACRFEAAGQKSTKSPRKDLRFFLSW
jgi:hypothetical protein